MNKPVFYITILLFFVFVFKLQAQQNLVPNSGFEDTLNCPVGIADYSAANWISPTWGTIDYFNSCNLTDVNVPSNFCGYQDAHQGVAYSGFVTCFEPPNENSREYIQVELISELEAQELYEFTCFLSVAEVSKYCLNTLGITLTNNPIGGNFISEIPFQSPTIFSTENSLCTDTNWVKVSCFYLAKGGEKFLTIGTFENDNNLNYQLKNNSGNQNCAYYYIDDVSLYKVQSISFPNIFTPNNDGINDVWEMNIGNDFEVKIFNRWGNLIINKQTTKNNFSWDGKNSFDETCSDGVYFYIISKNGFSKTGFIQLIH